MKYIYYLTLLLFSTTAFSQNNILKEIPNAGIVRNVLNIRFKDHAQTGFLYKAKNNKTYLITAKHLFIEKIKSKSDKKEKDTLLVNDKDTFSLFVKYDNIWKELPSCIFYVHDNEKVDIAVIEIMGMQIPSNSFNLGNSQPILGQDCFFMGYPLGYAMPFNKELPIPLIKKGVFSGIFSTNGGIQILLDGNNTFGLSGGPACFYDYEKDKWTIFAVISGYIIQHNEFTEENSGIVLAYSSNHILEILKKQNTE